MMDNQVIFVEEDELPADVDWMLVTDDDGGGVYFFIRSAMVSAALLSDAWAVAAHALGSGLSGAA